MSWKMSPKSASSFEKTATCELQCNKTHTHTHKKTKLLLPFLLCEKTISCPCSALTVAATCSDYPMFVLIVSFPKQWWPKLCLWEERVFLCQVNHTFQFLFLHQHLVWLSQALFISRCGPSLQSNAKTLPFAVKTSFFHILSSHC